MAFLTKYKKIFIILGFLSITVIIGYLIFSLFFKNIITSPDNQPDNATSSSSSLPSADPNDNQPIDNQKPDPSLAESEDKPHNKIDRIAKGGITQTTKINENPSIGLTQAKGNGSLQYYDKSTNKFYKIVNGKPELLSDKSFYNVEEVTWSPKNNEAIIEYPDGSNIVYDFENKKQITLPKHWDDFDFSTNGDDLVLKSIGNNPDESWLIISDKNGSKTKAIEHIGKNADTVYPSWSTNNQSIAMYKKGVDFDRQEIFFVGLNDENFKSLEVEGRGFQHRWSEKGDRLLYSVYSSGNDMKPRLWIANARGDSIGTGKKNLKIDNWAEKCIFSDEDEVYCAVPQKLETGAGLFPELGRQSIDNLYKINTRTGYRKLLATPNQDVNMSNLTISDNGRSLYFTDTNTQEIYKINLK